MIRRQLVTTFGFKLTSFVIKLLAFPIIVGSFSVSEYGVYGMVGQIIASGSLIMTFELSAVLRREVPSRSRQEQTSYFKSVHLPSHTVAALAVVGFLAFGGARLLSDLLSLEGRSQVVFLALILLIPSSIIKDIVRFFVSTKRVVTANVLQFFFQQSWTIVLIGLFFVGFRITLDLWIRVYLLCTFACLAFALWKIDIRAVWRAAFIPGLLRQALAFGVVILIAVLLQQVGSLLSKYLIIDLLSLEALGLFYFSMRLSQFVAGFSTTFINFVNRPYLIEAANSGRKDRQAELGGKMLVMNCVLFLLLSLPLVLNLDTIIRVLGKGEYVEAKSLVLLLFVASFMEIFPVAFYTEFFARGHRAFLVTTPALTFLVNTVGFVVALKLFGLVGCGIALIVRNLFYFLACYYPLRKQQIVRIPRAVALKSALLVFLTVLTSLLLSLSSSLFGNPFTFLFASSLLMTALTIAFVFALGIVGMDFGRCRLSLNWN